MDDVNFVRLIKSRSEFFANSANSSVIVLITILEIFRFQNSNESPTIFQQNEINQRVSAAIRIIPVKYCMWNYAIVCEEKKSIWFSLYLCGKFSHSSRITWIKTILLEGRNG